MPGQGQHDFARRAGIEETKQHALTLTHADRLAMAESLAVERRGFISDLEPIIRRRAFAYVLEAHEIRLPVMHRNQHLLVIAAGIVARLDDEKPVLARIKALAQISSGHGMAVIPTRAGGFGGEAINA